MWPMLLASAQLRNGRTQHDFEIDRLLGLVESTCEELSDYSDEQLTTLLEQLRDQLRNRNI